MEANEMARRFRAMRFEESHLWLLHHCHVVRWQQFPGIGDSVVLGVASRMVVPPYH